MEKFESSLPERQGELGLSPQEHYDHLWAEFREIEEDKQGKYADMPQDLVASMKETKLKIIEAYRAEHPELNN